MKKTEKISNLFKSKSATVSFAIIALISGAFFINKGITGNVVLTTKQPFDIASFIGLLLIICSIILAEYSIRNKK
ncbi:MAG: hypothetical protein J4472_02205 [DPANN group archaeon]|nr:hypothetical protein [DPANN group archaeon]HLD54672.1 hypothetical protein [Candidatus Nanoarchaeia archaeon]